MKLIAVSLLAVIAAGICYLVVSDMRQQRAAELAQIRAEAREAQREAAAEAFSERIRDPWGYEAKGIGATLGLSCATADEVHLASGFQRIDRFTCRDAQGDAIARVACPDGRDCAVKP